MTDFRALCAELVELDPFKPSCAYADWGNRWRAAINRAKAALSQPEPQGPPKNCWLDDEPDLYPSPCVFDVFNDPSDAMGNCVHAQRVKCKTDCKYYRADVQPEPQRPTDGELKLTYARAVAAAVDGKRCPFSIDDAEAAQLAGLRAVLDRWGGSAPCPYVVSSDEAAE